MGRGDARIGMSEKVVAVISCESAVKVGEEGCAFRIGRGLVVKGKEEGGRAVLRTPEPHPLS